MVEEKLGWTAEQAMKNVTTETFLQHGLSGMLSGCYKNSGRRALEATYGNSSVAV